MTEHDLKIWQEAQSHYVSVRRTLDMRFDFVDLPPYLPETVENLNKALNLHQEYLEYLHKNLKCDHFFPNGECAINAGGISPKYSWCSICGQTNRNDELGDAIDEYHQRRQRKSQEADGAAG